MQFQMQQLQSRISQLQRELASISSQLSSLSSSAGSQYATGISGGYGLSHNYGGFGSGIGSFQGLPGNIVAHTPPHSSKAGVGDSAYASAGGLSQGFGGYGTTGVSDYHYPAGNYGFSGSMGQGGQFAGGMGGGFSGSGLSGYGMSGYPSNIVGYTSPSATAGFSEVNTSPTGRQDHGVGNFNQAFRLGQ